MNKINLLFVITKLELGGAQKQLLSLIRLLDKDKFNLFLFTSSRGLLVKEDTLHSGLIKNRYLTIIKNESIRGFIFHLPAIVLYDLIQWVYILFFRPKVAKIFFSNLDYIKNAFQKRKK